ncbi:MAG: VWA domain-containing protein [archaeon]
MNLIFSRPDMLWFLLAIPLLFLLHFYALKYIKSKGLKFANFGALKRITGKKILTTNLFLLVLRLVIITFVVFAAAGTVLWYEGLSNENDFVIAIDTSASMLAGDFEPNRLEAAKEEGKRFINNLETEARIGLISFSGISLVEQELTTEKNKVRDMISEIEPSPAGSTDLAGAIITGTNMLLNSPKGGAIILITDGSATTGVYLIDALVRSIDYAKEKHIKVHAVGIGTNTGPIGYLPEYYNVSAVFNEENLVLITNETGGMYVQASSNEGLRKAYDDINDASLLANLHFDLTYYLILAALILIFVEWGLLNTKFRKIP